MAAARCRNNHALCNAFSVKKCLQLDEEELNQLREYVKERRRQYREQAGMYNRASANLATRAKTAAGAPKALNKREKRNLRAFGKGAEAGMKPTTPMPGTGGAAARSQLRTGADSTSRGAAEDDFSLQPQEPASLITQTAFRTMDNQVAHGCRKNTHHPRSFSNTFTKATQVTHLNRQAEIMLAQLTSLALPLQSPVKTALVQSKSSYVGSAEMQAKVQVTREKVVAATQPAASRPQQSAAADLINAATTSVESRERCAHSRRISITARSG